MTKSNVALMGTGIGTGPDRAMEAVEAALRSPLLNNSDIKGAKGILLNILSGDDEITMHEHQLICNHVQEVSGHASDQFIIGVAKDSALTGSVKVTIIATGFTHEIEIEALKEEAPAPAPEAIQQDLFGGEEFENEPAEEATSKKTGKKKNEASGEGSTDEEGRKAKKKSSSNPIQKLINFFDEDPI